MTLMASIDRAFKRFFPAVLQDKILQEKHAQEWVEREVRAGAASRAFQQEVAKRAALQWLRTTPAPFAISSIMAQLSYISQSLADLQSLRLADDASPAVHQAAFPGPEQGTAQAAHGGTHSEWVPTAVAAGDGGCKGPPTSTEAAEEHVPAGCVVDGGCNSQKGGPTAAVDQPAAAVREAVGLHQAGAGPMDVAVADAAVPDSAAEQDVATEDVRNAACLPESAQTADDSSQEAQVDAIQSTAAPAAAESTAAVSIGNESSGKADPVTHSQDPTQPTEPTAAAQPAADSGAAGLQFDQSAQPVHDVSTNAAATKAVAVPAGQPNGAVASSGADVTASGALQNAAGGLPATAGLSGATLIQQQQQGLQLQQQQQLMWQQWAYSMGMPHLLQQLPGLQQWGAAAAQPQQQWGVSQPQQQWGGWLGAQVGTHMPPYLAAQYLQQQAWGTQYSQGLQPGLSGLGLSGPLGVWAPSQPMGTHFGQQQTSNPFLGAPAAFPHPMQQDPQGGGDEMTDAPDWQPIPYGSPGHADPEPTAAVGTAINHPPATAFHGASLQPGTHSFATPLQSQALLYGQALQTGVRSMTEPLQNRSLSQSLPMQPIQQLQQEAARAQAHHSTPHLPTSVALVDGAKADGEPSSGLRLVDYTSDEEDRSAHSPSHTEQQSQSSHRSRSLQAGQSTGSMPVGPLKKSLLGPGIQSEVPSLVQHTGAVAAAAAGGGEDDDDDNDDDSEDMQEPAPPGVGSPAVSGQSKPFLHEPPLYRPTLQFASPARAATHADTAGSLQDPAERLQQPAGQSGLMPEHVPQVGQVGAAAGTHLGQPTPMQVVPNPKIEQPTALQSAAAGTSTLPTQLQAAAVTGVGHPAEPQPTSPTHTQGPSLLQPIDDMRQNQSMQPIQDPPSLSEPPPQHGLPAQTLPAHVHGPKDPPSSQQQQQMATRNPGMGPTPQQGHAQAALPTSGEAQVVVADRNGNLIAPPVAVAASKLRVTENAGRAAELHVGVLEALREMGAQHMTLALLTQTGALKAVQDLRCCQVAQGVTHMLAGLKHYEWFAALRCHDPAHT